MTDVQVTETPVSTPMTDAQQTQAVAEKMFHESAGIDAKPEEMAQKTEEKKQDSAPQVKIELKSDDLSKSEIDAIVGFAEKHKLSQDAANDLAKEFAGRMAERSSADEKTFNETVEAWRKQTESDPMIGGKDYERNLSLAKTAVSKLATEGFVKLLNDYGYGNHPEVVKTFMRIGKAISNDQMVHGQAVARSQASIEEKFYGGNKR